MRIRRTLLLGAVAAVSVLAINVGPATAAPTGTCSGNGTLRAQNGTPATWQISGNGSCISAAVARNVSFTGQGTSNTLGLCTPGSLVVTNLRLNVTISWVNPPTGQTFTETQTWHAPISLFPIATPFLVTRATNPVLGGAGVILHHLTLRCGDAGQAPSASFNWVSL